MTGKRHKKGNDSRSALSLPEEVVKPCSVLTAVGRTEITVDGHGGILAYETDRIRIKAGKGSVMIEGSDLVIDYYHNEELKIAGYIKGIYWEEC